MPDSNKSPKDTQPAVTIVDDEQSVNLQEPAETGESETALSIPDELPILPLRGLVVYPQTAIPLTVGQPRSVKLVDDAVNGDRLIGLVAARDPELETPGPDEIYKVGTLAAIHRLFKAPDGTIRLLVQGMARIRVDEYAVTEPYLKARVSPAPEVTEEGDMVEALMRNIVDQFTRLADLVPSIPSELITSALNVDDPLQLVYAVATYIRMDLADAAETPGTGQRHRQAALLDDYSDKENRSAGTGPQDPDRSAVGDGEGPARILLARAVEGDPARTR